MDHETRNGSMNTNNGQIEAGKTAEYLQNTVQQSKKNKRGIKIVIIILAAVFVLGAAAAGFVLIFGSQKNELAKFKGSAIDNGEITGIVDTIEYYQEDSEDYVDVTLEDGTELIGSLVAMDLQVDPSKIKNDYDGYQFLMYLNEDNEQRIVAAEKIDKISTDSYGHSTLLVLASDGTTMTVTTREYLPIKYISVSDYEKVEDELKYDKIIKPILSEDFNAEVSSYRFKGYTEQDGVYTIYAYVTENESVGYVVFTCNTTECYSITNLDSESDFDYEGEVIDDLSNIRVYFRHQELNAKKVIRLSDGTTHVLNINNQDLCIPSECVGYVAKNGDLGIEIEGEVVSSGDILFYQMLYGNDADLYNNSVITEYKIIQSFDGFLYVIGNMDKVRIMV